MVYDSTVPKKGGQSNGGLVISRFSRNSNNRYWFCSSFIIHDGAKGGRMMLSKSVIYREIVASQKTEFNIFCNDLRRSTRHMVIGEIKWEERPSLPGLLRFRFEFTAKKIEYAQEICNTIRYFSTGLLRDTYQV